MSDFESFKTEYRKLVELGVVNGCSEKELFLLYVDMEMNYSLKSHWESGKIYRYLSGVDDKPEEKK